MIRFATTLVLSAAVLVGCTAGSTESEEQSSTLTASPSARTPIALSGSYRFASDVKPLGRLTIDVVDTRSGDAETRLATLRAEGAACRLVLSNTYRCTNMHAATMVPSTSLADLAEKNRGLFVTFDAVTASPTLVSEGESLVEWEISQEGSSSAGPFTKYRYLELSGGLVKIILPGTNESIELIVDSADRLGKWDSRRKSESRWRWHEDMAIVQMTR